MKLLRSMSHRLSQKSSLAVRAFTLVELMVTVSIFVFMTTLVISKYGNFNQNVLLTNLAYDMALTFRTGQTFGVSVKAADDPLNPCYGTFQCVYGIHFNQVSNTTFILYARPITVGVNLLYTYVSGCLNCNIYTYTVRNGAHIDSIIASSTTAGSYSMSSSYPTVDVYFKRPDSSSHICMVDPSNSNPQCDAAAGITSVNIKIVSDSNPNNFRTVVVYRNGQIAVED